MRRTPLSAAVLLSFAFTFQCLSLHAQAPPPDLVSFSDFLRNVDSANPHVWLSRPESRVKTPQGFEEMRRHILALYRGVHAKHSFMLDSQVFDCIPTLEQPSARKLRLQTIEPPPLPSETPSTRLGSAAGGEPVKPQLSAGQVDAFGNAVSCDPATIPMRRVTLEELTRFASLREFFEKGPGGAGQPDSVIAPAAAAGQHRYAYGYQYVDNNGGNSALNIWSPSVGTGQAFSLSQQWYVGGSGTGTQTIEGGWQNYPSHYGTNRSVLFIYWTANNYQTTGCYNLECSAFVQTNSYWVLGGTFQNYSTSGGTQYEVTMQWKHAQGKWWLYMPGTTGALEAVGYYPDTLFGSGPLSQYSTLVEYGGETANTSGSTAKFPPMGSGAFASAGYQYAAYQRQIFILGTSGTTQWSSLAVSQPTPACYTVLFTSASSGGDWGSYLYFGGPGGTC
jgi:hypothetical protein